MSEGTAGWRLTRWPRWRHSRGGFLRQPRENGQSPFARSAGLARFAGDGMKISRRRQIGRTRRRGLAPVELVLALPIWMLLASAMVIVGNLGAWKVRGHLAAREAAARGQWPRTRNAEANSAEWRRPSAIMQARPTWSAGPDDPLAGHSVIRGPQIDSPATAVTVDVSSQAMETRSEASAGEAFLNEPPAVWPRSGARNRFAREFPILNGNAGQWIPSVSETLRSQRVWNLPDLE